MSGFRPRDQRERYQQAVELRDEAEQLVRGLEEDLAGAADPTRRDIIETRLREALELQDETLEAVAPSIERRREELRAAVSEVVKSVKSEPGSNWVSKYLRLRQAPSSCYIRRRTPVPGALGVAIAARALPSPERRPWP